jgi:antitoxin VapB
MVYTGGSVTTAKLFINGRSQAVRLPKEFRFEGREVRIRREGNAVILEPIHEWPTAMFSTTLSDDFTLPADPPAEPLESWDE